MEATGKMMTRYYLRYYSTTTTTFIRQNGRNQKKKLPFKAGSFRAGYLKSWLLIATFILGVSKFCHDSRESI